MRTCPKDLPKSTIVNSEKLNFLRAITKVEMESPAESG
jgi:hypothetical protein